MQLIDGKAVADRIKQEIAQEVEYICSAGGKRHITERVRFSRPVKHTWRTK